MSPDDDSQHGQPTRQSRDDDLPPATTAESFQDAIRALVLEAESNGVDVRGGWPVVRDDGTTLWDVEITEVARSSTTHVDETGSVVVAIVEAVAEREGVDSTDLPPLQDSIDHDVLETLQQSVDDRQFVRFQYAGHRITVRADGSIVVES